MSSVNATKFSQAIEDAATLERRKQTILQESMQVPSLEIEERQASITRAGEEIKRQTALNCEEHLKNSIASAASARSKSFDRLNETAAENNRRTRKSVAANPPPQFGTFSVKPGEPQLLAFDPKAFRIQAPPIMTVEELKEKFAHQAPAAD